MKTVSVMVKYYDGSGEIESFDDVIEVTFDTQSIRIVHKGGYHITTFPLWTPTNSGVEYIQVK